MTERKTPPFDGAKSNSARRSSFSQGVGRIKALLGRSHPRAEAAPAAAGPPPPGVRSPFRSMASGA